MKKHTGVLNNTGVRVLVVFRKLPDDDEHCLVVETDRLPDMYHDSILTMVNSSEAAKTNDFYEVLNRRTFPDGTNALQTLHYKNFLRKVPISNVTLLPFPGQKLPLELLNSQLDGTVEEYNEKVNEEAKTVEAQSTDNDVLNESDPTTIARGLIVQAELLENEAALKRKEAYELDPSLKPKTSSTGTKKKRGRPPLSPEEKALRAEQRKQKRKERDKAKALAEKEAKKAAKVEAALQEKIGN